MASQIIALERRELYAYCENLPAPIIARPVVIASLGRGMALALDCDGQRVTLTDNGQPCNFSTIDAILFELDGAPNVDTSLLEIDLSTYWQH